MKKNYFAPAVRLIDLEAEQMLALSTVGIDRNSGNAIDTEDAYSKKTDQDLWGNEDIWK